MSVSITMNETVIHIRFVEVSIIDNGSPWGPEVTMRPEVLVREKKVFDGTSRRVDGCSMVRTSAFDAMVKECFTWLAERPSIICL